MESNIVCVVYYTYIHKKVRSKSRVSVRYIEWPHFLMSIQHCRMNIVNLSFSTFIRLDISTRPHNLRVSKRKLKLKIKIKGAIKFKKYTVMVVTRKMSKNRVKTAKKKKNFKEIKIRECIVNIVRLTPDEINKLSHCPSSSQSAPNKKKQNSHRNAPSTSLATTQEVKQCSPTKPYNLRRNNPKLPANAPTAPADVPKRGKKKSNFVIAKSLLTCPSKLWTSLVKARPAMPGKNEIIIAKMKTYSPWPAKLVGIKNKKALVYFFGTSNHGEVNTD